MWLRRQGNHSEPELTDRPHDLNEFTEFDWLGDVAVGVEVVALQNVLVGVRRGEDHHRYDSQVVVRLDFPKNLPTVHLGKIQVQQDKVRA
jgi:hypothetical protein